MFKLTKAIEKELKGYSSRLPQLLQFEINDKGEMVFPKAYTRIKGEDLRNNEELLKLYGGAPIVDARIYTFETSVEVPQNHLRALKKAFKNSGYDGVKKYLDVVKNRKTIYNTKIQLNRIK